jgi:hypothetical protein
LHDIQKRLSGSIADFEGPVGVNVGIHRPPTAAEVVDLEARLRGIKMGTEDYEELLPDDLGNIEVSYSDPQTTGSRPVGPGLSSQSVTIGGDKKGARLAIRVAFSDNRAIRKLREEAEQLPRDASGLIMLDIAQAVGARQDWQSLIETRFATGANPEVSGVCLFEFFQTPGKGACKCGFGGTYFENASASFPVPAWLGSSLGTLPSVVTAVSGD